MTKRRAHRGFSLVETLATCALVALAMALGAWLRDRRASAGPLSLPASIQSEAGGLRPDRLEFLGGPFTPTRMRRQRTLRRAFTTLTLTMCLLVHAMGETRRAGMTR